MSRLGALVIAGLVITGCSRPRAAALFGARLPPGCKSAMTEAETDRCAGWVLDRVLKLGLHTYEDPAVIGYVSAVGRKVAAATRRDDLRWTFRVIDSDEVEAYALVGGYIYVSWGALTRLESEAELAALLAHEIGHVTAGHGADQLRALAHSDSLESVDLYSKFSRQRDEERQADELAVQYVTRAQYAAGAVASMLAHIYEDHQTAAVPSTRLEWRRTHPPARVRIARTAHLAHGRVGGALGRERFRRGLAELAEAMRRRRGSLTGRRYVNAHAGISLRVPRGWKAEMNEVQLVLGLQQEFRGVLMPINNARATIVRDLLEDRRRSELAGRVADVGWLSARRYNLRRGAVRAAIIYTPVTRVLLVIAAASQSAARRRFDEIISRLRPLEPPRRRSQR